MNATPTPARMTPPQRRDLLRLADGFGETASAANPTLRALEHLGLAKWQSTGFMMGKWILTDEGRERVALERAR